MKNKIVVVTGASSGIGKEIALLAQNKGNTVIWCSRNIENDEEIAKIINKKSITFNLDVTDEKSIIKLFDFLEQKFNRVDVLINNAGYVDPKPLLLTSKENWEKTISTNLTGTFLCTKYCVKIMKNLGGKIINISSTAGLTPRPGWSAYAAAKGAVINFSNAISEELSEYNIRIFILCPGRTATPLRKILAPNEDPITIMQPHTVAEMVMFCMTDSANIIEGQPIIIRERF